MVTLYLQVLGTLMNEFEEYAEKTFNVTVNTSVDMDLTFKNYKTWSENGGKELVLSGFKLTNFQMFWLSQAHIITFKNHRLSISDETDVRTNLITKYLHVFFKKRRGFRDAYHCDGLTESEREKYAEYESEKNN